VTGLELILAGPELLGPITLAEHEWREYEKRSSANRRAHCCACGRFVPGATVRQPRGTYWDTYSDQPPTGLCVTHGRVEVTWERA
jgi:hypothetical protein